jgi:DHA1 family bicyclomycin/chloramphenicol resistance-like MFS transporter
VLCNRTTVSYMVAMGLTFGSLIGYLGASRQIFQDQFGAGAAFALYFGALALILGAASLLNARLVGRFGMRAICGGAAAVTVAVSALFVVVEAALPVTLPMFMAYAGVLFFAFGLMFGNLNAVAMEPMGEVAGLASAIIGATSSIISLALGTLIGQLYDGTLRPIALGFLLLGLVSWLLMRGERRWHARRIGAA